MAAKCRALRTARPEGDAQIFLKQIRVLDLAKGISFEPAEVFCAFEGGDGNDRELERGNDKEVGAGDFANFFIVGECEGDDGAVFEVCADLVEGHLEVAVGIGEGGAFGVHEAEDDDCHNSGEEDGYDRKGKVFWMEEEDIEETEEGKADHEPPFSSDILGKLDGEKHLFCKGEVVGLN